ncbi:MAG: hypothetical protein WCO52_00325 [bacterium]
MPKSLFRRYLLATFVLLAWLGFVVEGSHALLSSSATLAGNTITTGSINLQISNSQSATSTTYADSRPGFNLVLTPGQSQESYFFVKNTSPMPAPLDIDALAVIQAANPDMAGAVTLEIVSVDAAGVINGVPVSTTLADLTARHLSIPVIVPTSATQRFKLKATLASSYTAANQSIGYDLVLTGTQRS